MKQLTKIWTDKKRLTLSITVDMMQIAKQLRLFQNLTPTGVPLWTLLSGSVWGSFGVFNMITQDFLREHFCYRSGSLYCIKKINQHHVAGKRMGYATKLGYEACCIIGKKFYIHRLIFLFHHGYMPATIDHINGVRNDNRIENLRGCTQKQNIANSRPSSSGTSRYKGVSWDKKHKIWKCYIFINGKSNSLGTFKIEEAAAIAYNRRALEVQGEYAWLNTIDGDEDMIMNENQKLMDSRYQSKYKGVTKNGSGWSARRNKIHIGTFRTEIDAYEAYLKFGEENG